jgi:hypothetical protein
MNILEIHVVNQKEIPKVKPLVPDPSSLEIRLGIEKTKIKKSAGSYQIPTEFFNLPVLLGSIRPEKKFNPT